MAAMEIILGVVGGVGGIAGCLALVENRKLAARSDHIQERLAEVEEARRCDELRPVVTMKAETEDDMDRTRLLFTNNGTSDFEEFEILAIVDVPPVIADDIKAILATNMAPLRMGESQLVNVPRSDAKAGGELVLRLRVRAAGQDWEMATRCEVAESLGPLIV